MIKNMGQVYDTASAQVIQVVKSECKSRYHSDELKSHPFSVHFLIDFYLKKTDLCAEMWNNSPNCYESGNSRERGHCSRSRKWLSRTDITGRRRLQQD